MDGRNRQQIMPGCGVTVRASPWPVSTVNDTERGDWFQSLHNCLSWNDRMAQKAFT
jgi:hypothetical protein